MRQNFTNLDEYCNYYIIANRHHWYAHSWYPCIWSIQVAEKEAEFMVDLRFRGNYEKFYVPLFQVLQQKNLPVTKEYARISFCGDFLGMQQLFQIMDHFPNYLTPALKEHLSEVLSIDFSTTLENLPHWMNYSSEGFREYIKIGKNPIIKRIEVSHGDMTEIRIYISQQHKIIFLELTDQFKKNEKFNSYGVNVEGRYHVSCINPSIQDLIEIIEMLACLDSSINQINDVYVNKIMQEKISHQSLSGVGSFYRRGFMRHPLFDFNILKKNKSYLGLGVGKIDKEENLSSKMSL